MTQRGQTLRRTAPTARSRTDAPRRAHRATQNVAGWLFAAPFVLVFFVFLAGPVFASAVLSFTDFGLRDLRNPLGTDFIGLDNYLA